MWGGPSRPASRPRTWRSASAVAATSASVASPKSAAWRRGTTQTSNGERDANGANATAASSSQTSRSPQAWLVADEPAERALALADDEPGGATDLLGDAVRDLGQVVQVEAQVVRPGAGLGAPVLDDLDVGGLAGGRRGRDDRIATDPEHLADDRDADRLERPMLARRGDDGPPAARRARLLERDLGEILLEPTGLVLGARRRGTRSP